MTQQEILTLLQSDAAREKVAEAFTCVSEATIYVPNPSISELKSAELNAKEWFTHGWNAALNALQEMIRGE